jgi:hypothetical protein
MKDERDKSDVFGFGITIKAQTKTQRKHLKDKIGKKNYPIISKSMRSKDSIPRYMLKH